MNFDFMNVTYNQVVQNVNTPDFIFNFLCTGNVIYDLNTENQSLQQKRCSNCNSLLKFTRCRKIKIGWIYRCTSRICDLRFGLFNDTLLEGISIDSFFIVLAGFALKKKIVEIVTESNITEKTVLKYFKMLREACVEKIHNENIVLGGENVEIEIDESHLFRRKYNRGRVLAFQQIWVFGIIERISKKVYLKRVERRDANTLNSVIISHVRQGSTIYGDGWRGYSLIGNGYNLFTVNHRREFVNRENPNIHTNNIERLWRSLKSEIRGVGVENVDGALSVFIFRRNYLNGSLFYNMTELLKLFIYLF